MRRDGQVNPTALLLILCAATFMSTLDLFIVNVGLRAIGEDVGAAALSNLSWVLNAYAIVFAALLVPAGRLADRYGNKWGFMFGLAAFSLASLGCALSSDLWVIVGMRCLQAVGAAALVPTSLGLILTAIPLERRKHSIQIWAVSGSLGAAAGPALGGLLVQLSWRSIFLLNVPIGIAAFAAAAVLAPDLRHKVEARLPDLLGGLLMILAIGSLSLGLVKGPEWGWTSDRTLAAFALSAVTLAWFVFRSLRSEVPVVDPKLFHHPDFTWANISITIFSVAFGMQLLGLVLWLQEGWGWSALETGLGIAPGPVMVSVTAIGLRRYTAKFPAGRVAAAGALLMAACDVWIAMSLTASPDYLREILPAWLMAGAGVGLTLPTIIAAGTAGLAAHQTSTGSAVVQMSRQIGSVLGVSILVVILGSAAAPQLSSFVDAWWWAAGLAAVAAVSALPLASRRRIARQATATLKNQPT